MHITQSLDKIVPLKFLRKLLFPLYGHLLLSFDTECAARSVLGVQLNEQEEVSSCYKGT